MRLIDADECPCYYCNLDIPKDCHSKGCRFWDWLKNAPTIEPKKGKWTNEGTCSECGLLKRDDRYWVYSYCPNCGAKME